MPLPLLRHAGVNIYGVAAKDRLNADYQSAVMSDSDGIVLSGSISTVRRVLFNFRCLNVMKDARDPNWYPLVLYRVNLLAGTYCPSGAYLPRNY